MGKFFGAVVVLQIALAAVVIFVAVHFITKFW